MKFPRCAGQSYLFEVESLPISHNPYHSCIRHGRWLLIDNEVLLSWCKCYCMMWGRTIGQYHTIFFIVSTFFHVNEDYWSIFFWLTKQHGRHISFFIWNFQIWEMTIDRQRSCNSFDVYAMTRYGGGLLVNIFSIIYFFTRREDYLSILFFIASNLAPWPACCPYDRRLLADIFFYRVQLGSGRMHPSVQAQPTCVRSACAWSMYVLSLIHIWRCRRRG